MLPHTQKAIFVVFLLAVVTYPERDDVMRKGSGLGFCLRRDSLTQREGL